MASSPLTVLHRSDIHFGKDHRFAGTLSTAAVDTDDTLLSRLTEDLKTVKDEADTAPLPDLLLLTGALAWWRRDDEWPPLPW